MAWQFRNFNKADTIYLFFISAQGAETTTTQNYRWSQSRKLRDCIYAELHARCSPCPPLVGASGGNATATNICKCVDV